MATRLTEAEINKLAQLIGTDWRTANRAGFTRLRIPPPLRGGRSAQRDGWGDK
jgi:hypothetical protein